MSQQPMNLEQWSSLMLRPTFWQRLQFLFSRKPEIIFCWGEDLYKMSGCNGWQYFAVGGVPNAMRTERDLRARAFGIHAAYCLLKASACALQSYIQGNPSPALARDCVDAIRDLLRDEALDKDLGLKQ